MIIDMHCHSVASDDARATVEQYLKWINVLRGKGYWIDGIVLTEHRKYDVDADYAELAERYGVLVLKGSELDTNMGHFLVYGVTEELASRLDFADVTLDAGELMAAAEELGAVALPAHPGRTRIGFAEFVEGEGNPVAGVWAVEVLNGGSRPQENERAAQLARERGYLGIGGSDAHFASAIGTCLTEFDTDRIHTEADLVAALKRKAFRSLRLEETLEEEPREVIS